MPKRIKLCPFCGGEAILRPVDVAKTVFHVYCNENGCTHAGYSTEKEAIEAWNTRAEEENPPLTIEELKQMNLKPIWIQNTNSEIGLNGWSIYRKMHIKQIAHCEGEANISYYMENYGKQWLAYRRKIEEVIHE
ncbi:MAG: Lar family restriction alleviation protein [Sedimentibacter sp.]